MLKLDVLSHVHAHQTILQALEAKSQLLPSDSSFVSTPEHSFHRKLAGWLGSTQAFYQTNSGNDEFTEEEDETDSWCVWSHNIHGYHVVNQGKCEDAALASDLDYKDSKRIDTLPTGCYYEANEPHIFWNNNIPHDDNHRLGENIKPVCLRSDCKDVSCQDNAHCVLDTDGTTSCDCNPGYYDENGTCVMTPTVSIPIFEHLHY